jgi:hypothetical protein
MDWGKNIFHGKIETFKEQPLIEIWVLRDIL